MSSKSPKKKTISSTEAGSLGGKTIFKKYGKEYMAKLGRKGAKARWKKAPKPMRG